MQFPREIIPPLGTVQSLYAVHSLDPIQAARRVSEQSLTLIVPHRATDLRAQAVEEQRSERLRRLRCRRLLAQVMLLDTRSGPDRRSGQRRGGEAAFNIDIEV